MLQIFVGAKVCGTIKYVEGQHVYKVDCDSEDSDPKIANVITIVGVDHQPLSLCEVMVMTDPSISSMC